MLQPLSPLPIRVTLFPFSKEPNIPLLVDQLFLTFTSVVAYTVSFTDVNLGSVGVGIGVLPPEDVFLVFTVTVAVADEDATEPPSAFSISFETNTTL